ncbi:MAG: elongation factor P [Patescibacteria group bacterium]|nr:elongation factor P [Patescibacteria group bacterium]MDD3778261.1 elongation factor P [Patescibacteria group bacterium]MDD3939613.1 elongation factor P [Patescibacteria group bacterium]MDD4443666.1 elongation factor P [Patescibacteria group bacterium]NCU39656.1 elongation factor P [Candidatus Falkowbacteria bacterium]
MLNFNEIKTGKVIKVNGEPFVIIKTDHHKMGRGGAVLKTKCRNLINGNILERTFQGAEKAEEAETETKKANYMYKDKDEAYFMDNESFEQFNLPVEELGDQAQFLKDGTDVDVLYFEGKPVTISLPIKMQFKVISAPPGIKGNSAGNVNKIVEIETGAQISVPMFINEGDIIRINTESGEYAERV